MQRVTSVRPPLRLDITRDGFIDDGDAAAWFNTRNHLIFHDDSTRHLDQPHVVEKLRAKPQYAWVKNADAPLRPVWNYLISQKGMKYAIIDDRSCG